MFFNKNRKYGKHLNTRSLWVNRKGRFRNCIFKSHVDNNPRKPLVSMTGGYKNFDDYKELSKCDIFKTFRTKNEVLEDKVRSVFKS